MRLLLAFLLAVGAPLTAKEDPSLSEKIDLAREAEDPLATIELLRRWQEAHPGDTSAAAQLVSLWLQVSDYDQAAAQLDATPGLDPGFVARSRATIAAKGNDDLPAALKILSTHVATSPKDWESQRLLASYLAQSGDRAAQIGVLDALIANEAHLDLLLDRAEAKLATGDGPGALADFRRAASIDPESARLKTLQPAFDRLDQSVTALTALEGAKPSPALSLEKAHWLLWGGMPAAALAEAESAAKQWPSSAYAKILLARALVASGKTDFAKAQLDFRVNVSAPVEGPDARAGILRSDAALAENTNDLPSLLDRVSWLTYIGQQQLALDDLQSVLAAKPSNITALHLAATVSRRMGNFSALNGFSRKLEQAGAPPDIRADVLAALSQMALEQYRTPLALEFADQSIAAKPTAIGWKTKAACHVRLGQQADADAANKNAEKASR